MIKVDFNEKHQEIEKNYAFFKTVLPDLIKNHSGKYALMRDEEIVGIYDTVHDAQLTGERFYEDGLFSVQKIDVGPIDLGYFSHALHLG